MCWTRNIKVSVRSLNELVWPEFWFKAQQTSENYSQNSLNTERHWCETGKLQLSRFCMVLTWICTYFLLLLLIAFTWPIWNTFAFTFSVLFFFSFRNSIESHLHLVLDTRLTRKSFIAHLFCLEIRSNHTFLRLHANRM